MSKAAPLAVFLAVEKDDPEFQQLIETEADYSVKLWDGAWLFLTDISETSLSWWAEELKARSADPDRQFLMTPYDDIFAHGVLGSDALAWLWEMGYGPDLPDRSGEVPPDER
ncbi:MAG: hypothetical protein QOD71_797 [Thermoleophilaceae bacterium]|jgi:hypothetical protein|nr:hypothetical protein [Thermoleophilaceae bacterium]